MNIGVIGANGFIGRSLCQTFLNLNKNVFGIFNNSSSEIPVGVKVLSSQNGHTIRYDFLIIAIGGHSSSYKEYINQFIFLQYVIDNYSFHKIIFISSVEVYGKQATTVRPKSSFNNPSIYGSSKLCQEFLIKSVDNYSIIRPTYIYGDGMNSNSLIPLWLNKAKTENKIVVYGDGSRKQDYLSIQDLCELCVVVVDAPHNDTIIAASGNSISNIDLAYLIGDKFKNIEISYFGVDNTPSSYFDISETVKSLGWNPKQSLVEWLNLN